MKTLVIIGAGPGLGLSLAKKFGENDFQVALLSRKVATLKTLEKELSEWGIINNTSYAVDITNLDALADVLKRIEKEFGHIDVVEFSPYAGPQYFKNVLSMELSDVMQQLEVNLFPAIKVVQSVLPSMKKQGSGAILFNSGISSIYPIPQLGNTGIACAALRNYAQNLHNLLKEDNIYVGFLSVATMIEKNTDGDPDLISEKWFELYTKQDTFEIVYPELGK